MDQPKIPTLKDSQKPQVKVRGLEAGATLFDRLKQFKKKDLAFILAGLGTLFMAPLAEHFMMSPESGDSALNAGFGGKGGGRGIFGDNGSVSPYETGVNGQAPGSAIGGGSDVITPLNVRDPSALVMGPGATQQPPTNSVAPSVTPPTAPVTHSDSDLKDALAASARGVGAAAHAAKALLPVPKVGLNSSGLRGLGAVSGGTTASAGPISSAGLVTGKANAGGGGLNNVRAMPGYKGAGTRGQGAGGDGLAALKAAGEKAGDLMNRGAAANALDATAAQQIPTGGSANGGAGEGGMGGGDKAAGGNQDKSSKSVGESLEFLKQKAMQEAQIALWAKEQEAGDSKLEMLKIRNSMAEAIAGKIGGAIGDMISCPITPGKNFKKCMTASSDPGYFSCMSAPTGGFIQPNVSGDTIGSCGGDGVSYYKCGPNLCKCSSTTKDGSASTATGDIYGYNCQDYTNGSPAAGDKTPTGGPGGTTNAGNGTLQSPGGALTSRPANTLGNSCSVLAGLAADIGQGFPDAKGQRSGGNPNDPFIAKIKTELDRGQSVVAVRDALANGNGTDAKGGSADCAPDASKLSPILGADGLTVTKLQSSAVNALIADKGAVPGMLTVVTSFDKDAFASVKSSKDDATAGVDGALKSIADAGAALQKVQGYWDSKFPNDSYKPDISGDVARLRAGNAQNAFDAIEATYQSDKKTLATLTDVQKQLAGDIKAATEKAGGPQGDDKSATVKSVLDTNVSLDQVVNKDGILTAINNQVPDAKLTFNTPDKTVVKDAKAGDDVAKATKAAQDAVATAKQDLEKFAKASGVAVPGASADDATAADGGATTMTDEQKAALKTQIQTKDLPAVTNAYQNMWKAQGGALNALSTKATTAQTLLTNGPK